MSLKKKVPVRWLRKKLELREIVCVMRAMQLWLWLKSNSQVTCEPWVGSTHHQIWPWLLPCPSVVLQCGQAPACCMAQSIRQKSTNTSLDSESSEMSFKSSILKVQFWFNSSMPLEETRLRGWSVSRADGSCHPVQWWPKWDYLKLLLKILKIIEFVTDMTYN